MSKKTPAREQFLALGLTDESAWTPAMVLAVKQKWSGLPLDVKVADLRAQLAALEAEELPSVTELVTSMAAAGETGADLPERAAAELKRRKRNAAVNLWRSRNQLQAALDARDLKFAALRAKRGTQVAVQPEAVPA